MNPSSPDHKHQVLATLPAGPHRHRPSRPRGGGRSARASRKRADGHRGRREEDKLRSKGRLRSHPRRNQQAYCGASQVSEKMKKLKSESEEHGRRRLKPWRRKSTSMPYVQRQSEELLLEYMTGCWRTTTHCKLRFFPSGAETELVRWLNRFDRNRN